MAGLSAGLASEGCHVIMYSIANFPTWRCAEQIRNDIDYHKLAVTVVSVGGGLAYGNLGYSHHAVQDYAVMRCLPNMLIAAPGDPIETRSCLQYLIRHPGPSYMRLGKTGEPSFHKSLPTIEPGIWLEVSRGESGDAILTTGTTLKLAMNRQRAIKGPRPTVYSLPLWGMSTKSHQARQFLAYNRITTIEDHLIDGGFGSWLAEAVVAAQGPVERLNIEALDPRVCGTVGSQETLCRIGGLNL
jgi:transketolase